MVDERISALEKLVESGIMSVDAARTARLKILEEKLMEDKITTPSIIKRERNGKIRYICVIPKSLSKDGERHQISGATPDECREKWMDAVYDNMEYQQDCKRKQEQQPETLCELMEEWMDKKNSTTLDTYYKGRSKKNTMTSRKNAIFLATGRGFRWFLYCTFINFQLE